jgi:hypothetical protein
LNVLIVLCPFILAQLLALVKMAVILKRLVFHRVISATTIAKKKLFSVMIAAFITKCL